MANPVAQTALKFYDAAVSKLYSSCKQHNIKAKYSFHKTTIDLFVVNLYNSKLILGCSLSTLCTLKYHCKSVGFNYEFDTPRLKLLLKGAKQLGIVAHQPKNGLSVIELRASKYLKINHYIFMVKRCFSSLCCILQTL